MKTAATQKLNVYISTNKQTNKHFYTHTDFICVLLLNLVASPSDVTSEHKGTHELRGINERRTTGAACDGGSGPLRHRLFTDLRIHLKSHRDEQPDE